MGIVWDDAPPKTSKIVWDDEKPEASMSAGAESFARSIEPLGSLDAPKKGPEVSQMGTFNRALAEGAGTIPTMLAGAGYGAELGAKTKLPYATPVGGIVGAISGGMLGHLGITSLEQLSDSVFGTKIMETKAAQDKAFPWTSKIGTAAGTLIGPGMAVGLPRTVAEAALGGTIMGGVGAGMRAVQGEDVLSPGDIALDVGSGMLGRPTALGEKMIGTGRTAVNKIGQAFSKKPEAPKTDSSPEPTVSDEERKSFLDRVKDKSPLTETAFRDPDGNILKTGPKHPDELRANPDLEPGFVDPSGRFYTRAEADAQARKSGQLPEDFVLETPTDGQVGLHSNDLRKVGDERFKVEEKPPTTSNNKAPVTREEHKDRIEIIEDDMYYLDIDEAIESTSLKKASNEYDQALKETIELAKLPQDENTRAKKKELDEKRTQLLEQRNEASLRIQELKAKIDQYTLERDKLLENLPKPKIDNLENPAWEEVHDIIYKAKTVGEALKKIEESGIGTRSQKWFAKLLATSNLVNEASLQLRKDLIPYRTDDGKTGSARGLYHSDNHRVEIGQKGDFETVLHEATHAAVWHLMHDNQSALAQKMNTLYEMHKASASPEARAEYGYDNVHEFVSEAMNNDKFKAHLKTTKSTEAFETKTTNLWDKLKQIVHEEIIAKLRRDAKTEEQHAEVEALKNNTKTALDEVMDIASGLIEESKNMKFDRIKKVPVDGAEPNKPAASKEIKEVGSDQDVLDGKAKRTSIIGFDKEGLLEDMRLRDKHTEVIKSMGRQEGRGWPTSAELNMLSKVADSITKQRDAHADKYKEHSLGKLVKDAQNDMKPVLVSSQKEVTKLDSNGPVSASKILPEEVKKAAKGIDVRTIGSEAAFMKHAEDIYASQGEAAALKFFEDWKKYKGTWAEPVKEVEKFVGINLNTKMANERIIHNEAHKMTKLVPKNIREEVARAIDKGEADKLTGPAKELADRYQAAMKDIGERAVKEGVVNGLLENYVTHIVNWKDMPKGALEELLGELFGKKGTGAGGMTPESRFGKERKIDTFENLEKTLGWINDKISAAGKDFKLEIKTTDVAEIYKEYALSMEKAIENKKLVDSVRGIRNVAGESLVRRVTEEDPMPRGWEMIVDRQFAGFAVHPDLAPALKFAFETRGNKVVDAFYIVSQIIKRLNVIASFFHAKSLMEVLSSAHVPLWTPVKEITLGIADKMLGTKMSGLTQAVDRFKEGGLGDSTDKWIKSGLVLEVPEDVTKGLLSSTGKFVDSMISKYGPKTRVLETSLSFVERYTLGIFDKITWDFLHTGGKLYTADKYLEKQRLDAMKSGKEFNEDLARAEITQFINRSFGGLNWFQEASKANTEFGKRMSMAAFSPQGRKNLQMVLFAPDWTISTIKAFTSALPEKLNPKDWHPIEGIKGMVNPTTKADYARLYQFKTALLYFTLLNAINMVTANRPIWENKDPTRIEFPDGTSMQAMKHAMEPYHWLSDPVSTLSNKLGFLPKAAITGLTGLEYASPYAPKLVDPSLANRAGVIAKSALPFQISAAVNAPEGEGVSRAVSGTMGFPIYGKTAAEKKLERSKRSKEQKEVSKKYKDKARERGWE